MKQWLEDNWNPDLTVAEWWDILARSGYAAPTFPEDCWGKGWPRDLAMAVADETSVLGAFDGATFSHVGARVSFETLLAAFDLETPALLRMGRIKGIARPAIAVPTPTHRPMSQDHGRRGTGTSTPDPSGACTYPWPLNSL